MSKQVRVNIKTAVNNASIRREERNGRQVIIVPSATLPDNVVMNRIRYPAEEIAKSFHTLNRKPAPLGHPVIGNKFLSASDPEGLNLGWIGAWNENVRQQNGRVLLDKVIDVTRANESEGGRKVLNAIDKGEPIHTSTGLICQLTAEKGEGYEYSASNMEFDHDAILLNEEGAATPAQGVGMLVNSEGKSEEIEVINSALDKADDDLDWAIQHLAQSLERRQRAPLLDRMKQAILDGFGGGRETAINGDDTMSDDKRFEALETKVNSLTDSVNKLVDGIGETVANTVKETVKPLTDSFEELKANQKAKDDAELAGLVETIVKANLLDEADAKELTLNAARALAKKAKPGKAAALNGAGAGANDEDEFKDYSLNSLIEPTDK